MVWANAVDDVNITTAVQIDIKIFKTVSWNFMKQTTTTCQVEHVEVLS